MENTEIDNITLKREKYRQYYHDHKEEISQYRKDTGLSKRTYRKYYDSKKEEIRAKNLARYHAKKALKAQASEQLRTTESLASQGEDEPTIQTPENSPAESENVPA